MEKKTLQEKDVQGSSVKEPEKQVEIVRSYGRKIRFGDQYEMLDMFASYKVSVPMSLAEEESDTLYKMAQRDVDVQVDILKNPGRMVRGYASIEELKKIIKAQNKEMEKMNDKISDLKLKLSQHDGVPF